MGLSSAKARTVPEADSRAESLRPSVRDGDCDNGTIAVFATEYLSRIVVHQVFIRTESQRGVKVKSRCGRGSDWRKEAAGVSRRVDIVAADVCPCGHRSIGGYIDRARLVPRA